MSNDLFEKTDRICGSPVAMIIEKESSLVKINSNDLKNTIELLRTTVCDTVGEADVKVWMAVDASGKIFGIGVSGDSGIEITFHCK